MEKILNPLPEFDPFDKAIRQHHNFSLTRSINAPAISDRCFIRRTGPNAIEVFQSEDERLKKQQGTSTGLTDHAQDLVNNTIANANAIWPRKKKR